MNMTQKKPRNISRRGFVVGATATAATAAAVSLGACSSSSDDTEIIDGVKEQFPDAQVEYLDVDFSQVRPHTEMANENSADYLAEVNSFELPLGSLVYQCSDSKALALAPGASSKVLTRLLLVDLNTADSVPILGQALGSSEDYVIYDARASDAAVVWVECNMVHGLWRVYAASLIGEITDDELLSRAQLLEEGEEDYSPPQLAVSNSKVYWTVMPDPNGTASSEDSFLKAAELGLQSEGAEPEVKTVYTSHGRMITNPTVSGDLLTIVPRVDTGAVYYQLTTLDIESDAVQHIAILPPSLRVVNASWLGEGFSFGIEGNYDYANGLSLFGTYEQLGDGDFLYVNKAPVSAAVRMGSLTFVKSTKNVLGISTSGNSVVIVDTPQDCVDYGDILAGEGTENRLVLYTTVTAKTGQETGTCRVRVFDLL